MRKDASDDPNWQCEGNERWEGFLVDLIKVLSERLHFQYELYEVPDGNYGGKSSATGQWNGMIHELMIGVRLRFTLGEVASIPLVFF